MKVSQYASEVINSRPYKYQTRLTYLKDLKRLGIWDLDVSEINSALIRDKVEKVTTQSTRKRLFITARSIFKDLGICQDLPNLEAEGKIYDIPTQEQLEWLIDRSKYRLQLLLCMFGGLRVGEACAVTPEKLSGDYLDVNQAYSQDGLHLGSLKTYDSRYIECPSQKFDSKEFNKAMFENSHEMVIFNPDFKFRGLSKLPKTTPLLQIQASSELIPENFKDNALLRSPLSKFQVSRELGNN